MTLVLVSQTWVNPDKVIAVYVGHHEAYVVAGRETPERWSVYLACEGDKSWTWKFDSEEQALRHADKIAAQVNQVPPDREDLR